ncbi:MAG: hypothetical protein JKY94_16820 [Rhodobacteraceae bacterium]|nr:hypothetical protein [Paracoccaceae bacterium]
MAEIKDRDQWKSLEKAARTKVALHDFGRAEKAALTKKQAEAMGIEFKGDSYHWTMSGDQVDSYEDIIRVQGWNTKNYLDQGAIVQWAHETRSLPIGTMLAVWKEIGLKEGYNRLRGIRHFHKETAFSNEIATLVSLDILCCSSVGFRADDVKDRTNEKGEWIGFDFRKQTLLEDSVTPIPALAGALIGAKSAGQEFAGYRKELERSIEERTFNEAATKKMQEAHKNLGVQRTYSGAGGTQDGDVLTPKMVTSIVEKAIQSAFEARDASAEKALAAAAAKAAETRTNKNGYLVSKDGHIMFSDFPSQSDA